jgi:hypothetical protein
MGQGLGLRFGAGSRSVDLRGIVCWSSTRGSACTTGVQFSSSVRSAPGAWSAILAEVSRSSPKA